MGPGAEGGGGFFSAALTISSLYEVSVRREGEKYNSILEKVQCSAEDYPFDTVLVSLSQGLPHRFFLGSFSGDANSSSAAIRAWRVLLYLSKFNALGRYIMTSIGEVEHAPESCVRVRFRNLEEGEIGGVRRWKGELVDG